MLILWCIFLWFLEHIDPGPNDYNNGQTRYWRDVSIEIDIRIKQSSSFLHLFTTILCNRFKHGLCKFLFYYYLETIFNLYKLLLYLHS
jgi:hypothetical protein